MKKLITSIALMVTMLTGCTNDKGPLEVEPINNNRHMVDLRINAEYADILYNGEPWIRPSNREFRAYSGDVFRIHTVGKLPYIVLYDSVFIDVSGLDHHYVADSTIYYPIYVDLRVDLRSNNSTSVAYIASTDCNDTTFIVTIP